MQYKRKFKIMKEVKLPFRFTKPNRYEISNMGRIRSFNRLNNGRVLKGANVCGYRYFRLCLFKPREDLVQENFDNKEIEIGNLYKMKNQLNEQNKPTVAIDIEISKKRKMLSKSYADDLKRRAVRSHLVIHREVAKLFLPPPFPGQTIVAHLDYDKQNNRADNLKWMTKEENTRHQFKSPNRKLDRKPTVKGLKLTVEEVRQIKRLLKRGATLRRVAEKFNVSDMQIHRIKIGENWSHVKI